MKHVRLFLFLSLFCVVWLGSFFLTLTAVQDPMRGLILLLSSFFLPLSLLIVCFVLSRRVRHLEVTLDFLKNSLQSLELDVELHIFKGGGASLFSTQGHFYPTLREFSRKLLLRFSPSQDRIFFKKALDEGQGGTFLLRSGGNSFNGHQNWWLTHVVSTEVPTPFTLIHSTNCSEYVESYMSMKRQYEILETFVDTAPFGVFYLNRDLVLIGCNATFCSWLQSQRSQVLGQKITHFMDVPSKDAKVLFSFEDRVRSTQGFYTCWANLKVLKGLNSILLLCPEGGVTSKTYFVIKDVPFAVPLQNTIEHLKEQELFIHSSIPTAIIDEKGNILAINPAFAILSTHVVIFREQVLDVGGNIYSFIYSSFHGEFSEFLKKSLTSKMDPFELRFVNEKIHLMAYVSSLHQVTSGGTMPLIIQFVDISEQKHLEKQFIQSQKMQAVGQLAGGIAHDFNNLLTAMIGFCDLLLQKYMPSDSSYTDIIHIKQSANRAANLIRQLLAFSKKQTLQPKVLLLTDVLTDLSVLLRRLIGANIDLQLFHGRDLWPIRVDPSQLEQVIINLVINARDAMINGGSLVIRTGNYEVMHQEIVGHDKVPPGAYVLIEVIDTGIGIAKEHMDHIFDPFFSTKEVGMGTGLGLSTVYGIIKQTNGYIGVESEPQQGTIFKIFFRRYEGSEVIQPIGVEPPLRDLSGHETILLVEDEDVVRLFSARALREKGYRVLEASTGEEALDMVRQGMGFDLLITDVIMPHMDGPTLSKHVQDLCPHMKVIFISGYTEDTFRKNLSHDAKIHFLSKPFTLKDLVGKVKDVLVGEQEI